MAYQPKSQDEYLYHGIWTDEHDTLILTSILREKQLHKFKGTVIPHEFLYEAEATIEEETAYTKNGEPEFKLLKMLFSGDINVSENDIETIVLSDTTIDLNPDVDEGQCEDYVSGYNHDSHLLPRKLFNESSHSHDCESSNSMEIRDRELGNDLKISSTTALTTPQ
ncbi:hypothetical protein SASPL_144955 [Salvia splendens]|uniref:Uncharacterized protein n=1 Tax=Salvia splendens TaxID=180675 RepID=A0A8X8WGR7_SALSN|nr:hypothetical protein SASPL_144955 [Salvia splendens]